MVFDFVDNASQYNTPMSLHRLFKLRKYRAGELVLSPWDKRAAENALYDRREKPAALLDWPIDATDYELVDVFNWQEEAEGRFSKMEFVRLTHERKWPWPSELGNRPWAGSRGCRRTPLRH